jgi:hypothetical protein
LIWSPSQPVVDSYLSFYSLHPSPVLYWPLNRSFVDRYIPGYIFFSDGITRDPSVTTITHTGHPPGYRVCGFSPLQICYRSRPEWCWYILCYSGPTSIKFALG